MSGNVHEETLRLQFGTASNTIGTQWLGLRAHDQQDVRAAQALLVMSLRIQTLTGSLFLFYFCFLKIVCRRD